MSRANPFLVFAANCSGIPQQLYIEEDIVTYLSDFGIPNAHDLFQAEVDHLELGTIFSGCCVPSILR